MLSGYKTYIVMFIGVIVNGSFVMGFIDTEVVKGINALLVFLGFGAFRSAMKKK